MGSRQRARGRHLSQPSVPPATESAGKTMTDTRALSAMLDDFQVRPYVNLLVGASDLAGRPVQDAGSVNELHRAVLTLPYTRPQTVHRFDPRLFRRRRRR